MLESVPVPMAVVYAVAFFCAGFFAGGVAAFGWIDRGKRGGE
jgi:hypothetical protein